jgi:FMN phosphatase YigB (HAD superfamily)
VGGAHRPEQQRVDYHADPDRRLRRGGPCATGFTQLPVHPDVPDGVRALRASGRRLVTLSNGSAQVAEKLLSGAGIRDEFEHLLSVEDAGG